MGFNLAVDPCLRVTALDGTVRDLPLPEVYEQAASLHPEIGALCDADLVGILQFLVVVAADAYKQTAIGGEITAGEAEDLIEDLHKDPELLLSAAAAWVRRKKDSLELDRTVTATPWLQVPADRAPANWDERTAEEKASGLFSNFLDKDDVGTVEKVMVLPLLMRLGYGDQGGIHGIFGPVGGTKGGRDSCSWSPLMLTRRVLVGGDTLAEMLVNNLTASMLTAPDDVSSVTEWTVNTGALPMTGPCNLLSNPLRAIYLDFNDTHATGGALTKGPDYNYKAAMPGFGRHDPFVGIRIVKEKGAYVRKPQSAGEATPFTALTAVLATEGDAVADVARTYATLRPDAPMTVWTFFPHAGPNATRWDGAALIKFSIPAVAATADDPVRLHTVTLAIAATDAARKAYRGYRARLLRCRFGAALKDTISHDTEARRVGDLRFDTTAEVAMRTWLMRGADSGDLTDLDYIGILNSAVRSLAAADLGELAPSAFVDRVIPMTDGKHYILNPYKAMEQLRGELAELLPTNIDAVTLPTKKGH